MSLCRAATEEPIRFEVTPILLRNNDDFESIAVCPLAYLGCVALVDIPEHTVIHTELALLQPQDIWTAQELHDQDIHTCQADDDEYLATTLGLSKVQRDQIWDLHDQRSSDETTPNKSQERTSKRLLGIILSNSFCNSDWGMEPMLFGGLTSRFNHSCRPNVGIDFAAKTIRMFTTKEVKKGQELCLCYNNVVYYHSAGVRKAFLEENCHFLCQCEVCRGDDPSATLLSDSRRRLLLMLAANILDYSCQPELEGLFDVSFLFSEEFEKKVENIQTDHTPSAVWDIQGPIDAILSTCDLPALQIYLQLLLYMEILQLEGIDHDMTQCFELAYDLTVFISNNTDSRVGDHPMLASTMVALFRVVKILDDAIPQSTFHCSPVKWGQRTLRLLQLHKGKDHDVTKQFQNKLLANIRNKE